MKKLISLATALALGSFALMAAVDGPGKGSKSKAACKEKCCKESCKDNCKDSCKESCKDVCKDKKAESPKPESKG